MREITQKIAYIIKLKDGVWLADDDQEWKETVNKKFAAVFFEKGLAENECDTFGLLYDDYPKMEIQEIK